MNQSPKYVVLVSHLGRPSGYEESKSLKQIIPILEKYLDQDIIFLEKGLSSETIETLSLKHNTNVFLLENINKL